MENFNIKIKDKIKLYNTVTNNKKQNITINMVKDKIKLLDKFIDNYFFPNRSSLIRYCIDLALPIIAQECEKVKESVKNNDLPNVLEFLKSHGFVIHCNRNGGQPKIAVPLGNIHFNSNNGRDLIKVIK